MFKFSLVLGAALCGAVMFATPSTAIAHGGQYRGPRDLVPPGGGGNTPVPPSTPSGPNNPNTPSGPGTPTAPNGPPTGGVPTPGSNPLSGGLDVTASFSDWSFWWGFNKDRFLDLKRKITHIEVATESDEYVLGFMGAKGRNLIGIDREAVKRIVFPVIQTVLEDQSCSADEHSSALVALAKLGLEGERSVELIARHLDAKNQEVSETAAVALGILAEVEALPMLSSLLRDDAMARKRIGRHEVPVRTRAFAAYGLGLIGTTLRGDASSTTLRQIEGELLKSFQQDRESTDDLRVAALSALSLLPLDAARIQELAESTLLPVLRDRRTNNLDVVRAHIPTTLARWSRIAGSEHPTTRAWADLCTQSLGDKKEKSLVAQSMVLALGVIEANRGDQSASATRALIQYANDGKDKQAQQFCMIALGQIGGAEALKHLRATLHKGKNQERAWAAIGLGVRAFEDRSTQSAPVDPTAAEDVLALLEKDRDPSLLGAYSISLGLMSYSRAREGLENELRESNIDSLKGQAGIGLGLMNATASKALIQSELGKSKRRPDQLQALAIALGLLGDREVVDLLLAHMKEARTTSVHAALAQALGFIGDQRSLVPLCEMARGDDLTAEARAFALVALGIACDKERLPWNEKIAENANYLATVSTLTGGALGVLDIL